MLTIRNFPLSREVNINHLMEREDNVNFLNSYRATIINNTMTNCHFYYENYKYYLVYSFTKKFYQDELG